MKPNLVAVGHLMKEMIRFPGQTLGPVLGGAAAYYAVVASRLGTSTGIVSYIGKDMPSELLDPLHQTGVDVRGIRVEGNESRSSELLYDKRGHKTMRYPAKGQPIRFRDIPNDYLQADMIYVCPQEWEVSLPVIEQLSKSGRRLAVELGGYGGAHCSYHPNKEEDTFLKRLLPYFHIAKLSIEDAQYLFRGTNGRKVARVLIEWGVDIGIVTLAERGAILATENELLEIPPLTQKAVDCTGAGDCFAASFAFSYIGGNKAKRAGLFASAATSLMIEKSGGLRIQRMPSLYQVNERLARSK